MKDKSLEIIQTKKKSVKIKTGESIQELWNDIKQSHTSTRMRQRKWGKQNTF